MKLLSHTPPWKLALAGLLLVILVFVGTANAQSAVQALTQRVPIPDILGVFQWVLGICLAATFAIGYTVYTNVIKMQEGLVAKLVQMERDQRIERALRRRYAAATLSVLLMLNSDAFETALDRSQITERFRKVMENGDEH